MSRLSSTPCGPRPESMTTRGEREREKEGRQKR